MLLLVGIFCFIKNLYIKNREAVILSKKGALSFMKEKIAIVFLLMWVFLVRTSYAQNLIKNGDFSEIDVNGKAMEWEVLDNENSKVKVLDNALCIENNITTYQEVSQMVRVLPNRYYKVSAKVKILRESDSGAYLSIKVFSDYIKSSTEMIKNKSDDYKTIVIYGKTDDSQSAVTLNLCLGKYKNENVGKALFKDIQFEELDYVPKNYEKWYVDDVDSKVVEITVELISKLIFTSFVILMGYVLIKMQKDKLENGFRRVIIDKKDIIIICILTGVYLGMALYNLGDRSVPETKWKQESSNEYVIIELPKMTHIGKLKFYEGFNDKEANKGAYKVQYLDEQVDDSYERYHILRKKAYDNFKWRELREDTKARTIKIEVMEPGIELREFAVYEKGNNRPIKGLKILEDKTKNKKGYTLIDEPNFADQEISYKNQAIFDEVLYARTGYEYLNNMEGFEKTHPPLGKIFMAMGIKLFGMNPFGWRIMGTMFGVMMIPIMYLFTKKLFKERFYAIAGALMMMFDCMHFTQTRTSLIDSYSVFFIILMYYYMADIYMSNSKKVDKNYVKSMVLAGIFFSLGAATKWTVVYGALGLFIFYIISLFKNLIQDKKEVLKSMLLGMAMFVILPIIVYLIVYIPVFGSDYTIASVFSEVKSMFLFHKNESIVHKFASKWYEWFIILKPMCFYRQIYDDGLISEIHTMGNPMIWWISFVAVVYSVIRGYKNKDNMIWIFVIGYVCQYLPWMFITRTTFIYHYFSVIPFAIFAIIYMLKNLFKPKYICVYLATVIIMFWILYPTISGAKMRFSIIDSINNLKYFW